LLTEISDKENEDLSTSQRPELFDFSKKITR
jgi:hypothetical protein